MEIFVGILLKTISIILIVVFIASVVLLILTFRKPRKVSILSLIITIAISLITLVIFSSLIKYKPPLWLWLLMFCTGIVIGWFWARTTKVFVKDDQVMSRNSIWYLIVWGTIFAINQLIIIVTKRPPDIAMAMLIVSSATVWGINGNVMMRYFQIKTGIQSANSSDRTASTPPTKMAGSSVLQQNISGYCAQCGIGFIKDDVFCKNCGKKL